MPSQHYNTGNGLVSVDPDADMQAKAARHKMTDEEAAAVLVLVRGGWLRLELNLDDARG